MQPNTIVQPIADHSYLYILDLQISMGYSMGLTSALRSFEEFIHCTAIPTSNSITSDTQVRFSTPAKLSVITSHRLLSCSYVLFVFIVQKLTSTVVPANLYQWCTFILQLLPGFLKPTCNHSQFSKQLGCFVRAAPSSSSFLHDSKLLAVPQHFTPECSQLFDARARTYRMRRTVARHDLCAGADWLAPRFNSAEGW